MCYCTTPVCNDIPVCLCSLTTYANLAKNVEWAAAENREAIQ